MFLRLDGTALIQLINFAIFFALLNVLFLRPVGQAIRKRREYMNGLIADYDRYQAEGNALRANAERVRAEARREAEQLLAKRRAETSNETADIAARHAAKVQTIVEEAQQRAGAELERARGGEEALIAQLAGTMADRAVGEAVHG